MTDREKKLREKPVHYFDKTGRLMGIIKAEGPAFGSREISGYNRTLEN